MAATIFTISCSGEDGPAGAPGSACYVQLASDGSYDVICGGARQGTLAGGTQGAAGGPGAQGSVGDACLLGDQAADGSYPIICGGSEAGTLNGCSYTELDSDDFIISCGATSFGLCDGEAYNPSEQFCNSGSLAQLVDECGTGKVKFNPNTHYCGYATKSAYDSKNATVIVPCNNDIDNAINVAAEIGEDGSNKWGWDTTDPSRNGAWVDQYCRWEIDEVDVEEGTRSYTKEISDPVNCDGTNIYPNNGEWKGEYCGFEKQADMNRKLVATACGNGDAPDSVAYAAGYCQMAKKTDKFTQMTEDYCDVGPSASSVATPINRVNKFTKLSITDWKSEYCGYSNEANTIDKIKSVETGVCDDEAGPNDGSTWQNGYCQATSKTDPSTKKVGGASAYCIKNAGEAFKTAGDLSRFNKDTWEDEYCGYSSKEDADSLNVTVQKGICSDGTRPNASSWGNEYCRASRNGATSVSSTFCGVSAVPATKEFSASLNKDTWQDQYCGYADKAAFEADPKVATVLKGTCNDGSTSEIGPNQATTSYTSWINEYCQADRTGKTQVVGANTPSILTVFCLADTTDADYTTAPATARINDGTWQNQYCGFATKAHFDAETKTFTRLSGFCDDGQAPNLATSSYTAWTNDYCQVKEVDMNRNTTTKVSGANGAKDIYCTEAGGSDFADAPATARLNEGIWKGEFCFDDNVKGLCLGGLKPVSSSTLSTDTPACDYP
jgi:hypothetical protein